MPSPSGPLTWVLRNTRNQSIGNRVRDGEIFLNRVCWWAKNPVTVATIIRHSLDGVTWIDTSDVDGGNSDNPQRIEQMIAPGDGFLYFIADPGTDAGLAVFRTNNFTSFAQYQGSLSLRATQYGGIGPINLFPPPHVNIFAARTESLAAPVEAPATFINDPPNWEQDAVIGGSGAITAIVGGFNWESPFAEIESRAVARSAEVRVFSSVPGSYDLLHTALATIHRMIYWPSQAAVIYARFWQGAEPANTSRIYSTMDANDWAFTERYAGQITGIVSDFIVAENDLYFTTVDGQPTGTNVRIYRATSLTSAPILIGTITPANPALDSSVFLVWHPGMNSFFTTLQTLAGPARQEIYQASLGGASKQKRLRRSH